MLLFLLSAPQENGAQSPAQSPVRTVGLQPIKESHSNSLNLLDDFTNTVNLGNNEKEKVDIFI